MSEIITVSGPIKSEELGFTSMHEHTISNPNVLKRIMIKSMPYMMKGVFGYQSGEDVKNESARRQEAGIVVPQMSVGGVLSGMKLPRSNPASRLSVMEYYLNELEEFKKLGGQAICDCSPVPHDFIDTKPVLELSERSGVHIVGATGYYIHPSIPKKDVKAGLSYMTDKIQRYMEEGDPVTGWRPGFGKCAIGTLIDGQIALSEQMAVEATARAAKNEGFCLHIHTAFPVREAQVLEIADMLTDKVGMDPGRVIFCHMDSYNLGMGNPSVQINEKGYSLKLPMELLRRGFNVGLDTWSIGSENQEEIDYSIGARKAMLLDLVEAGFAGNITLGHDMMSQGGGVQNNRSGYALWPQTLIEMIDAGQIEQKTFDLLTVENPRRILSVEK